MNSNPNFDEDPGEISQEPLSTPDPSQIPAEPPIQPPVSQDTSSSAPTGGLHPQVSTISAQQPPVPPVGGQPLSPRRSRWWLWLIGVLLFLVLIGGGLVAASYMGWIVLGLEELWGGVSKNPHKALVQIIEKSIEIEDAAYTSSLSVKLRSGSEVPELTKSNNQKSFSYATLSYFTNVLNLPSNIAGESSKVLGEYTSADSMDYNVDFTGESTEKVASFQITYRLTNDSEVQSFEEYLKPFTNSENEVILDSITDLEENNAYLKVSSLEIEGDNPWIKSDLPKGYYKDKATLQESLKEDMDKFKDISVEEYKEAFKVAQNKGVRSVNGHKTYLFNYIVSVEKLIELYAKIEDDAELKITDEEDYDVEINLWVGINDRYIHKIEISFTTKETSLGSLSVKMEANMEYQDIQIEIPNDEDTVNNICNHPTLLSVEIVKSYCTYTERAYNPADSAQTRDIQRKTDLRNIQVALEEYKDENGKYPICESICKTNNPDSVITEALNEYLSNIPTDPLDPEYFYGYLSDSSGSKYRLTCVVEVESSSNFELKGLKLYKLGNL